MSSLFTIFQILILRCKSKTVGYIHDCLKQIVTMYNGSTVQT